MIGNKLIGVNSNRVYKDLLAKRTVVLQAGAATIYHGKKYYFVRGMDYDFICRTLDEAKAIAIWTNSECNLVAV